MLSKWQVKQLGFHRLSDLLNSESLRNIFAKKRKGKGKKREKVLKEYRKTRNDK